MNGVILDYEHFATHDGPGIRLVVFLKGCPLRCKWCHTPESQRQETELLYFREHCLGCGSCNSIFRQRPLISPSREQFKQIANCPVHAVSAAGKIVTAAEIAAVAEKEKIFFDEGGGLTISGGEPLFQAEFTLEIARLVNEKNISCCIETCGFGSYDKLKKLLPYTDIFLFDYKATDAGLHRELTGQDNKLILENLRKLDVDGARIILRCPLIGGMNDQLSHLHAIAELAEELPHIEAVHVEPYHPMARGKYLALGLSFDGLPETFPDADTVNHYIRTISANTSKPVLLA